MSDTPQEVSLTYQKMREYFRAAERNRQHLTGYIVFSPASFAREYSLESRTYAPRNSSTSAGTPTAPVPTTV